eukprot:Skav202295  [mRNA]  locus=scaffold3364:111237:117988:- [translate_table: standard]
MLLFMSTKSLWILMVMSSAQISRSHWSRISLCCCGPVILLRRGVDDESREAGYVLGLTLSMWTRYAVSGIPTGPYGRQTGAKSTWLIMWTGAAVLVAFVSDPVTSFPRTTYLFVLPGRSWSLRRFSQMTTSIMAMFCAWMSLYSLEWEYLYYTSTSSFGGQASEEQQEQEGKEAAGASPDATKAIVLMLRTCWIIVDHMLSYFVTLIKHSVMALQFCMSFASESAQPTLAQYDLVITAQEGDKGHGYCLCHSQRNISQPLLLFRPLEAVLKILPPSPPGQC